MLVHLNNEAIILSICNFVDVMEKINISIETVAVEKAEIPKKIHSNSLLTELESLHQMHLNEFEYFVGCLNRSFELKTKYYA